MPHNKNVNRGRREMWTYGMRRPSARFVLGDREQLYQGDVAATDESQSGDTATVGDDKSQQK